MRIHGRGGQGAVIASKILATASFKEGLYCQAFPSFWAERRGAPVAAFLRMDENPILIRTEMANPDHLIVLDSSLVDVVDILRGLRADGWVIINSPQGPESFEFPEKLRVATVDASTIATRHGLGSRAVPIVNTAILGAFSRATGLVQIDSILDAIAESVPSRPEANRVAAREAYESVVFTEPA